MKTYYVTLGVQYNHQEHPCSKELGIDIDAKGYFEVDADDSDTARAIVVKNLGTHWAFMYDHWEWENNAPRAKAYDWYPRGCLGRLS